ncbi:hypothetical protein ASD83_20085 [Devosia sp. Root685]|nr:hypothetical protein ASD83_20085 [Devosia sp. Root685]
MEVGPLPNLKPTPLALRAINQHIGLREVGADVFLANRVRSGRKQPQRDPHGSMPASYSILCSYLAI